MKPGYQTTLPDGMRATRRPGPEEHVASQAHWTNTGLRWNWSGEDVPAMTVWFE